MLHPTHYANGMTFDADLNLLACEHASSCVARFRPDGTRDVLASHFEGKELNSPNDIVVHSDGSLWFTDPTYGRTDAFGVARDVEMDFRGVYRLCPGGVPELVCARDQFVQPNGLTFSPDERLLYVNDSERADVFTFDVTPDGLTNPRLFASGIRGDTEPGVPDGMKCDTEGNVWVTGPGGVWVYASDATLLGKLSCPQQVANLHWGGADWGTLFLCANTSLYAVMTKARPRTEPFMRA